MNIDRNQIIELIKKSLHDLDFVNALWLEGADSQGLVDDYSDIDMWIDVNEGKQDGVLQIIRNELSKLGEIDFDFEKNHPHPQIRQMFLHIKGSSKYLILDLCIQSNDRVFWYTNGMDGEKVKIIFDNKKVIRFKPMNTKEYSFRVLFRNPILTLLKKQKQAILQSSLFLQA